MSLATLLLNTNVSVALTTRSELVTIQTLYRRDPNGPIVYFTVEEDDELHGTDEIQSISV